MTEALPRRANGWERGSELIAGVLVLTLVAPVGILIGLLHQAFGGQPERAVGIIAAVLGLLVLMPPVAYLVARRRNMVPSTCAFIALTTVAVVLIAVYAFRVNDYIRFPADFLIWSESDFVNDILKLRVGYPLYTVQANNESFNYPPGSQILTYLLAKLTGHATSIPVYRGIQVLYTLLAAGVAASCCRRLLLLAGVSRESQDRLPWMVLWLPVLFLIATNALTNPFVHNLHNDALTQLVTVTAYWLLVEYASARKKWAFAAMACVPALGFLIKQSLGIWAILYCIYLALFDRPRSPRRLIGFALAAFGGIAVVAGAGYGLWHESFIYWTVTVIGSHPTSILRSAQHLLDAWIYPTISLVAWRVLQSRGGGRLAGLWVVWLLLFAVEAYTSGIAWMMNHLGPGSLIAGVWFLAAVTLLWGGEGKPEGTGWRDWAHAGAVVAVGVLILGGLGTVRVPQPPLGEDAYRYKNEIEREFAGLPTDRVLLDVGTWVYLRDGVIMKDRAVPIGDRGLGGVADFSGILARLGGKRYSKILVRRLHAADLWYDSRMWSRSSGIRDAMLRNYQEVGTISKAFLEDGLSPDRPGPYTFDQITILTPRPDAR